MMVCGLASVAQALPSSMAVTGRLSSASGGPIADGKYPLTFALFKSEQGGSALWSEPVAWLEVAAGSFHHTLGNTSPLKAELLNGVDTAWLEVKVEPDPALTRVPLRAVALALRANVAGSLDCSGCVGTAQLDPSALQGFAKSSALAKVATTGNYGDLAGAPDFAAFAKKSELAKVATTGSYGDLAGAPDFAAFAKKSELAKVATTGSYSDLAGTPKLAAVASTGAYADLNGQPTLAKLGASCGTGLVMRGLKADGSYDCIAALDPSALPADGLAAISNQLLTNQFTDVVAGTSGLAIADNNPTGVSDSVVVPDLGTAQALTVSVELANSDISSVKVKLYDPANTEYVLYDKGGKGNTLKATWPAPDKTIAGDLTTWIGKNPKGKWSLQVIDTAFLNNAQDGLIKAWSVNVGTLSSKKVAANGTLVANAGLKLTAAAQPPVVCDASQLGFTYVSTTNKAIEVCNGTDWYPISIALVGTQKTPALSCLDVLKKMPTAKTGAYWLDPDGASGGVPAFQAYCEMDTDGGGWTLVGKVEGANHNSDGGVLDGHDATRWKNKQYLGDISNLNPGNALGASYESVAFTDFMLVGLNSTSKRLAWRMPKQFTSLHAVFNAGQAEFASKLLVGNFTTLDWRPGCGVGNGPDGTGPEFYGFNVRSDGANTGPGLFNGNANGWCAALAGWGRNNNAGNYTGGGLGADCQGRAHQMGRHYWGYGDGCDPGGWSNGSNLNSFFGHAFFVR
jgi:subtilisin-like proprotein convertase family protein